MVRTLEPISSPASQQLPMKASSRLLSAGVVLGTGRLGSSSSTSMSERGTARCGRNRPLPPRPVGWPGRLVATAVAACRPPVPPAWPAHCARPRVTVPLAASDCSSVAWIGPVTARAAPARRSLPWHEGRWRRAACRRVRTSNPGLVDQHGVFHWADSERSLVTTGPAVAHFLHLPPSGIEHGFDGDGHAGFELVQGAWATVVQHLRLFMKLAAYAVAAKFAHHAQAVAFGKLLDGMANIAQKGAVAHLVDAVPHGLVRQGAEAACRHRRLAHHEHAGWNRRASHP